MNKIIIYGMGKAYNSYQPLFHKYEKAGLLQIVGAVRQSEKDFPGGCKYPLLSLTDLSHTEFDQIIIATNRDVFGSSRQNLQNLNIPSEKIMGLSGYFLSLESRPEYYNDIVERQLQGIKKILSATDAEISDYNWMYQTLSDFGMYPSDTRGRTDICWTEWGTIQIMEEFVPFCNMLGCLENIHTAIEVGVFRGRSSYIMCALLSRKNPDLKYTLVDICDNLDSYDHYHQLLPALDKQIPSTSEAYQGKTYDFVFIDADHSYDAAIQDYRSIGQHASKITVFHDIYGHEYDHLNGGIVRAWKEILEQTPDKIHRIFSEFPDRWMGIGCVINS